MKKLPLIIVALFSLLMVSCTAEITVTDTGKGVEIFFNGGAEKGFENLIKSMGAENQDFIDPAEITKALTDAGFSNVKVSQKSAADLSISMVSENTDNFLFKSGVLVREGNLWAADFSREKMNAFYQSADSQIVQVLDLLLAPVFNDEEMTVEEYLEVIASFYGDSVAQELATSKVKVVSKSNSVKTNTYSLAEILCGLVTR